jgi:hypothetical protein
MSGYDARALSLSLTALGIVTALRALIHVILSLRKNGVSESPFPPSALADILSVEWDLAFIGFVTLIRSHLINRKTAHRTARGVTQNGFILRF